MPVHCDNRNIADDLQYWWGVSQEEDSIKVNRCQMRSFCSVTLSDPPTARIQHVFPYTVWHCSAQNHYLGLFPLCSTALPDTDIWSLPSTSLFIHFKSLSSQATRRSWKESGNSQVYFSLEDGSFPGWLSGHWYTLNQRTTRVVCFTTSICQ